VHRDPGLLDRIRQRSAFGRGGRDPRGVELAGLLLTGGYRPRPRELQALRASGIFAYLVEDDTYAAASRVHDLLVKTHPADLGKIAEIKALVAAHIDVDRLLERFAEPRSDGPDEGAVALVDADGLRRTAGTAARRDPDLPGGAARGS
jgi:hypothetical protein